MLSAPTKVFKNVEGKKVYCWNKGKEILVSLTRLDEGETGKFKSVPANKVNILLEKLGVPEKYPMKSKEVKTKVEEPKQETPLDTLGFYRKDINLQEQRQQQKQLMEQKVSNSGKDKNISKDGFMDELALISGSINKPVVREKKITESQEGTLYKKNIKIKKKSLSSDGIEKVENKNKLKIQNEVKEEELLQEGKNDRIILGKITTGEEDIDGLGWIKIENIPTTVEEGDVNTYKYKLQGIIEAQLNKDVPRLKQIPEVANMEKKTVAELTGELEPGEAGEDVTGLGELTGETGAAPAAPESAPEAAAAPVGVAPEVGGMEGATEAIAAGTEAV